MDLPKEIEIVLRNADFETWPWSNGQVPVICFESESVLGFVHIFSSADSLRDGWEGSQDAALARFNPAMRRAGEKAWNVYSLFLTEGEADGSLSEAIASIEENFHLTRKIARHSIDSSDSVVNSLLPLLPIRNKPKIGDAKLLTRLEKNLQEVNIDGANAFLKGASPSDIAQILAEKA